MRVCGLLGALLFLAVPAMKAGGVDAVKAGAIVWADEFNGPAGAGMDPAKWMYQLGAGGWGNQELQFYTNRRQNVRLDGAGHLVIEARMEDFARRSNYTSGRLATTGKFARRYGRFEARIKLPKGKGLWPAFWMMGENVGKVGWPKCGEIDVMEFLGHEPGKVYGYLHGPGYSEGATVMEDEDRGVGTGYGLPGGKSFPDGFHVFAIEWTPRSIRWFVDAKSYLTLTPNDLRGARWVFDQPFFILINLAVGGEWPGNPDSTTRFPQQMLVDWIRVRELPVQSGASSATAFRE